jgi:hypothetical protein
MAEREDTSKQQPTGAPDGGQGQPAGARPQGDSASNRPHRPHPRPVDEKNEQEMVIGGHGHGGIDDLEVEKIEQESKP